MNGEDEVTFSQMRECKKHACIFKGETCPACALEQTLGSMARRVSNETVNLEFRLGYAPVERGSVNFIVGRNDRQRFEIVDDGKGALVMKTNAQPVGRIDYDLGMCTFEFQLILANYVYEPKKD